MWREGQAVQMRGYQCTQPGWRAIELFGAQRLVGLKTTRKMQTKNEMTLTSNSTDALGASQTFKSLMSLPRKMMSSYTLSLAATWAPSRRPSVPKDRTADGTGQFTRK